jgi:hypothetical protein
VEATLTRLEAEPETLLDPVCIDVAQQLHARKRPWWRLWSSAGAGAGETAELLRGQIAELESRLARQQEAMERAHRDRAAFLAAGRQVRQLLDSVIAGYIMGLQRIDRALTQHDLEVIDCVGEPFDPESMEVVEVVLEPGRSGTEVLEEVRRGYLWEGRLFRHAQVRVARP